MVRSTGREWGVQLREGTREREGKRRGREGQGEGVALEEGEGMRGA